MGSDGQTLCIVESIGDGTRVLQLTGELDLATREQLCAACVAGSDLAVSVDLAGVTFMDCGGYGALVRSAHALTSVGGSLTFGNDVGQPRRLLTLLRRHCSG